MFWFRGRHSRRWAAACGARPSTCVAAGPAWQVRVHRGGQRLRFRRLPPRPAPDERDRVRQPRQGAAAERMRHTSRTTRVVPVLTLNLGVRWEYESPVTEAQGRLVNLDVTPDFTAVDPSCRAVGTDRRCVPNALVRADKSGIPAAARSGVAAGAWFVARRPRRLRRLPHTNVYQSIALLLAAAAAVLDHVRHRASIRRAAADAGDGFRAMSARRSIPSRSIPASARPPPTTGRRRCSRTCRRSSP